MVSAILLHAELRSSGKYITVITNILHRKKFGIHTVGRLATTQPYLHTARKITTRRQVELNHISFTRFQSNSRRDGPVVTVLDARSLQPAVVIIHLSPSIASIFILNCPIAIIAYRIELTHGYFLALYIVEVNFGLNRQRFYTVDRCDYTVLSHSCEIGRSIGIGIFGTQFAIFQCGNQRAILINQDIQRNKDRRVGHIVSRVRPIQGHTLRIVVGRDFEIFNGHRLSFRGLGNRNLFDGHNTVRDGCGQVETHINRTALRARQTKHLIYRTTTPGLYCFSCETVGHTIDRSRCTPFDFHLVGIKSSRLGYRVTNQIIAAGFQRESRRNNPVVGTRSRVAVVRRTFIAFFNKPFCPIVIGIDDGPTFQRISFAEISREDFGFSRNLRYILFDGERVDRNGISSRTRGIMEREIVISTHRWCKEGLLPVLT